MEVIGKDAQDPGKQEKDLPEVEEEEAEVIRVSEDTQDPGEQEEDQHEGQEEEQCWGSGSAGSTGCFWASGIRIH